MGRGLDQRGDLRPDQNSSPAAPPHRRRRCWRRRTIDSAPSPAGHARLVLLLRSGACRSARALVEGDGAAAVWLILAGFLFIARIVAETPIDVACWSRDARNRPQCPVEHSAARMFALSQRYRRSSAALRLVPGRRAAGAGRGSDHVARLDHSASAGFPHLVHHREHPAAAPSTWPCATARSKRLRPRWQFHAPTNRLRKVSLKPRLRATEPLVGPALALGMRDWPIVMVDDFVREAPRAAARHDPDRAGARAGRNGTSRCRSTGGRRDRRRYAGRGAAGGWTREFVGLAVLGQPPRRRPSCCTRGDRIEPLRGLRLDPKQARRLPRAPRASSPSRPVGSGGPSCPFPVLSIPNFANVLAALSSSRGSIRLPT